MPANFFGCPSCGHRAASGRDFQQQFSTQFSTPDRQWDGRFVCPACGHVLTWRVLSPDGVPIEPDPFPTLAAADAALTRWCQRFAVQGYYAAATGERIALADLPSRCAVEGE